MTHFKVIIIFSLFLCSVVGLSPDGRERKEVSNWVQRGPDLVGTESNSQFGRCVDASYDASRIVVGEPWYDALGNDQGRVNFYEWSISSNSYASSSAVLNGEAAGDKFGFCAKISKEGEILAVSAPYADLPGIDSPGKVYVYRLTNSQFLKIGDSITASDPGAHGHFGFDLSLSHDGVILAIGERGHDSSRGRVHVFDLDLSSFVHNLRATFVGDEPGDWCGLSLSISAMGEMLAVGCPRYGNEVSGIGVHLTRTGRVKIFKLDGLSYQFQQNIDGPSPGASMGRKVALSGNFQSLAVGASQYDPTHTTTSSTNSDHGAMWVFELANTNYVLRGSVIVGINAGDQFGKSVAISSDGKRLVASAEQNDANGLNSGSFTIYDWNSVDHIVTKTFHGSASGDNLGSGENTVVMSTSGNVVIVGAPFGQSLKGYVQIFKDTSFTAYPSLLPSVIPTKTLSHVPSNMPSIEPSKKPSFGPSNEPSFGPSKQPSFRPSKQPSFEPSKQPSFEPSIQPSFGPSDKPSNSCHPNCSKKKQCFGSNLWIQRCKMCDGCKTLCLNRCRAKKCSVGRWKQKCRGCSFC